MLLLVDLLGGQWLAARAGETRAHTCAPCPLPCSQPSQRCARLFSGLRAAIACLTRTTLGHLRNAHTQTNTTDAQQSGVAQEATATVRKAAASMGVDEARKVLGVAEAAPWAEVAKRYKHLFEVNKAHGSFYLQSKVYRAREALEEEYTRRGLKPPGADGDAGGGGAEAGGGGGGGEAGDAAAGGAQQQQEQQPAGGAQGEQQQGGGGGGQAR